MIITGPSQLFQQNFDLILIRMHLISCHRGRFFILASLKQPNKFLSLPVKRRRRRQNNVSGVGMSVKASLVEKVFLSTFIVCPGQSLSPTQ